MSHRKEGLFARGFKRLIEARARDADRYVASQLLLMDDETLKARGYNRDQLRKISGGGFYY